MGNSNNYRRSKDIEKVFKRVSKGDWDDKKAEEQAAQRKRWAWYALYFAIFIAVAFGLYKLIGMVTGDGEDQEAARPGSRTLVAARVPTRPCMPTETVCDGDCMNALRTGPASALAVQGDGRSCCLFGCA